jgi:EAL domain-containing protein (putative c-di-GMP-specific phosphodiesterase class I)/GGDEF domain-containing protein
VALTGRTGDLLSLGRLRVAVRIPRSAPRICTARVEVLVATLQPRDATTRLPGRAALLADLRRLTEPTLLVLAALTGLRGINAEHGPEAGDAFLREAAGALAGVLAPCRLFRTGDAEFGWLMTPPPLDESSHVAEVLGLWQAGARSRAACAGWVLVKPGAGAALALGHAGGAVRVARSSPSRVAGFTMTDARALERRQFVSHALADALAAGGRQLHLVFQPIRRLDDGELVAVETLARWNHPTMGVITPDEFVTLAEQTGQSCELDGWVLQHALAQLRDLPGSPVVHINVSAVSVTTPGFTDQVLDLIGHCDLDPARVCVELTETALASSSSRLRHALATLHTDGIKVSIDDFGTGHASWSYLSELPVSELKLDKSYVQRLAEDPAQAAVVKAILEVAHTCGQQVVAEGIETLEQARALVALGCVFGQGYLLGRPAARLGRVRSLPRPGELPTAVVPAAGAFATGGVDRAQDVTDLARALSDAPRDPASLFRITVELLRRSIDFDGGSLQLLGSDGVRLVAADPPPPPEAFAARLPPGQGVAGTVLTTGRPVYLPDILASPAVPTRRRAISGGVRSYLAVPLFDRGQAIGVLQVDSSHVDAFGSADRLQLAATAPLLAATLRQPARLAVPPSLRGDAPIGRRGEPFPNT